MFRVMRVRGSSMAPALEAGALVLLDERAYTQRGPQPGEIVAARPEVLGGRALVKRVCALPAEDAYVLLGDRADDSFDSRAFGPVTRRELIGRVRLSLWPFRNIA